MASSLTDQYDAVTSYQLKLPSKRTFPDLLGESVTQQNRPRASREKDRRIADKSGGAFTRESPNGKKRESRQPF